MNGWVLIVVVLGMFLAAFCFGVVSLLDHIAFVLSRV